MKQKFELITKNAGQEFFFEDEHFVLIDTGQNDNEAIFHFIDKEFAERTLVLHNELAGIEDVEGFMRDMYLALKSAKGWVQHDPHAPQTIKRVNEALALFPKKED